MKTEVLQDSYLEKAKQIIENDGVVAFPTDTVYGLACSAFSEKAIDTLYNLKDRDSKKPLIVMIPENYNLENIVKEITPNAEKLMKKFWPGALTIIFISKNILPKNATGGLETVGVRLPALQDTIDLLNYINTPIFTTSANISGQPSPITAQEVYNYFNGKLPLIIDKGVCDKKLPSTIVDLSTNQIKILRVGSISEAEIYNTLKE